MKLYNTLTRRKEELRPVRPGRVGIYTCGPTVYMFAHIGNFRSFLFADFLRRGLEFLGYAVDHVMNITDVGHLTDDEDSGEDKFELSARREGKKPGEIARFYEDAFWADVERIGMLRPTRVCHATEHIEDMIELVRRIEANGFAYRTSVGLVFDTAKFPGYADLARLNLAEQQFGARVQVDPERRNPADFALWITNQPRHLMQWDSPWGRGFPGWHLECSAMSIKYLGERFDIHTGGIDHIPVHHTNERAQNFAATGHQVVNTWLHGAFLTVGDARMGKSEGNLITLSQLEERGFSAADFRFLCLTALYRTPLSFTEESITSARNSLRTLVGFGRSAQSWSESDDGAWLEPFRQEFRAAVEDDLNLPQALATTWNLVREANKRQDRRAWNQVLDFDRVFGLG
ncbi:cysteine--tRNA ligase, partial [candidate division WOR-3 bacterium]|nr:cysteine--tRNA ligase [candidate division WOR-3 bacterium]